MTCASHTLRRVIAPAWRSGVRALVPCPLLATPAGTTSRLTDIADGPLAESDAVVVPRTRVEVEEHGARMVAFEAGVSFQDRFTGVDALGVGARDQIGVLQVLKGSRRAAGGNRGDVMGEMSVKPGLAPTATLPGGGTPRGDDDEALPDAAQEFEVVFPDQGLGTMTQADVVLREMLKAREVT